METYQKIEQARYQINRFDHYNDSINNKGAFYLSINTFIFGGLCVGYGSYCEKIKQSGIYYPWLIGIAAILLFCCLASILCTIVAITPYLKDNHVNDDQPSLIYFGGISRYACNDFLDKFSNQSETSMLTDCSRQTHSLAKGLTRKFRWFVLGNYFLLVEYVLLIILIFLLFQIL
jgi:hypothetical protein